MKLRLLLLVVVVLTAGCASALLNGQIALRQGRYVEAEGYFNEALAKDPGGTDALVGLGIAQYKAGRIEESIDTLEKAVQIRPNEPSVRLYLALGYLKRGEKDKAVPVIYRLDKDADTLTICWDTKDGKVVPTEFATKKDSGLMLIVLKHEPRAPATEKDPKPAPAGRQ